MFGQIIKTALTAGALASVFLFAAHMVKTSPLIVHAEVYEGAGPSHAPETATPAGHAHEAAAPAEGAKAEAEEWGPADGFERSFYTFLADLLTSCGFAFLLVAAIAMSGRNVDWRSGMVWGLCGFAAFFAAPSLGLAPELPGMQAADLHARQIWWVSTVVLTAGGLALLFLSKKGLYMAIGALLILTPHLIGAPAHQVQPGALPAELAAEFVAATMVISGLFWLLLGGLSGHFYGRYASDVDGEIGEAELNG